MDKLLPCPFCGGLPYPEKTVCDYTIRCTICSATMMTKNDRNCAIAKPSAADLWNKRDDRYKHTDIAEGVMQRIREMPGCGGTLPGEPPQNLETRVHMVNVSVKGCNICGTEKCQLDPTNTP